MNRPCFSMHALGAAAAVAALMSFGVAQAANTKPAFGAVSKVGVGQQFTGVSGSLQAVDAAPGNLDVNLAGTPSFDGLNAAGNTVLTFDLMPGALIDSISYSLTLATVGVSWLSEATIQITNSAGNGVALTPGFADGAPGTMTYTSSSMLSAQGLQFNVGADGKLIVQFYESFDDVANLADAVYTSGTLSFNNVAVVPEPATYGLMALGLFGVGAWVRRRRS